MVYVGYVLLFLGILLSLFVVAYESKRLCIARREPQAAPRRLGPEPHMLAMLLTGGGAWLAWDLRTGLLALLPQGLIVVFLMLLMMKHR